MGKDEDPTERNRSGNQNACVNNYSAFYVRTVDLKYKKPAKNEFFVFFQCVMKISTCENEVKKRSTKLEKGS